MKLADPAKILAEADAKGFRRVLIVTALGLEMQAVQEHLVSLGTIKGRDGNFLEHEILQRGVLWGLGRLAHARPWPVKHVVPLLLPFMRSEDALHPGLAAWTAGAFATELAKPLLQHLASDRTTIPIYIDTRLVHCTVAQLAMEALNK